MAKHLPPVPPAGRSDKGPGASPELDEHGQANSPTNRPVPQNLREQGRQGNIKQNTTNVGYQQDR